MARVNRGVPSANGELLFCELPDGTRGALPAWMTDAAACAALTVGQRTLEDTGGRSSIPVYNVAVPVSKGITLLEYRDGQLLPLRR